jgi:hypothetical protein
MGAAAKLNGLKHEWVMYAVFAAVVETFRDGLDSTSLTNAVLRIGLTFGFAWYLTRQLLDRSSLVWAFVVVFTLLASITSGIEVIDTLLDADGRGFELGRFLLAAGSVVINIRTFRVLRDREVKHHVMLD